MTLIDNNDGITVIDVTDPGSPAYCFVSVAGTESENVLPLRVPLSAEQYLRAYYPVNAQEEMEDDENPPTEKFCLKLINALHYEKMVTSEMLAGAWPHEYTQDAQTDTIADSHVEPSQASISSLVDLAVPQAVKHALDTGDMTQIKELLQMPRDIIWEIQHQLTSGNLLERKPGSAQRKSTKHP
jgi:hypothetical protein